MDFELRVGNPVWIRCEVKKGPFPDERLVRVHSAFGEWLAFISSHLLKDTDITEGQTEVPAIVVQVSGDHYLAKLPGSSLTTSLFKDVLPPWMNHRGALQA
jgi:hypothetical protein